MARQEEGYNGGGSGDIAKLAEFCRQLPFPGADNLARAKAEEPSLSVSSSSSLTANSSSDLSMQEASASASASTSAATLIQTSNGTNVVRIDMNMAPATEMPTDDLFAMYLDMDKINSVTSLAAPHAHETKPIPHHHARSFSVDGIIANNAFLGKHHSNHSHPSFNLASEISSLPINWPRFRHRHSNSVDGSSASFKENELLLRDSIEPKKAMAPDKLAELALLDPKRAKRILANRQSAARSKERKMHYITDLERKLQRLQTEATTLSAQLSILQRDTSGLTNENNELKIRLQTMEQQAQLRDALNEALREEVQRLRLATSQGGNNNNSSSSSNSDGHMLYCPELDHNPHHQQIFHFQQGPFSLPTKQPNMNILQSNGFGALDGFPSVQGSIMT